MLFVGPSALGADVMKQVEAIVAAYNHDGSDIQSDYFDVNFYSHVNFTSEVHDADRAEALALYDAGCAKLGDPNGLDFRRNPYGAVCEIEDRLRAGGAFIPNNDLDEDKEVLIRSEALELAAKKEGTPAQSPADDAEKVPGFI